MYALDLVVLLTLELRIFSTIGGEFFDFFNLFAILVRSKYSYALVGIRPLYCTKYAMLKTGENPKCIGKSTL